MPTLVILIVLSISFYFFYKIKVFRTKAPAEKKWINTKANMALGSFLAFFGLNQIVLYYDSLLTIIIGSIFILLGLANVIFGYQAYRHFLPLAIQEAEQRRMDE